MFLMLAVWFISYTKSDFTHGISLLKNNSGSGKTQRSTVITKHRDWRDCENTCNILASKCTSFIYWPSKDETGGHCHFMVRRDPSIQTCNDRIRATGAIWNNVAGYKKPKYVAKYICNHPEHILARSIRNSALQIEERTISFADGTTFKEPALTQISDVDCAIVCKYTDKCEVYNYINYYNHATLKREKLCFLIEKPHKFERKRCPTERHCKTNYVFH